MSDRKSEQREPDELELERESIGDLEVEGQEGEEVRGGCKATYGGCNYTGSGD